MRIHYLFPAMAVALALSACTPGYYDNHGNFVEGGNGQDANISTHPDRSDLKDWKKYHDHNEDKQTQEVPDGSAVTSTTTAYNADGDLVRNTTVTTYYSRAGYYDQNGKYVVAANAPKVPRSMWPAKGWCRIWYPSYTAAQQPAAESCTGIETRVPDGAFVIYGG